MVRGPFQACHLSYSVDGDHEGRGVMEEIVRFVLAFDEMDLHRVMANHMVTNIRSEKLLARLGFEREGFARRYLKINGRWEDHVLNSLIHPADR